MWEEYHASTENGLIQKYGNAWSSWKREQVGTQPLKRTFWFTSLYSNEHLTNRQHIKCLCRRKPPAAWNQNDKRASHASQNLQQTLCNNWLHMDSTKVSSEQNDITPLHLQFPPLSFTWQTWKNTNLKTQWSSPLKMAAWTSKPPIPKCSYLAMGFPLLLNRYMVTSVQL